MKRLLYVLSFLLVAALVARPAHATSITFDVDLLGLNEVPPNPSPALGHITVTLDDVLDTLFVSETFSGLVSPTTAAHLHCCVPPAVNGPVVLPLFGFPLGVLNGTYVHLFNLNTDLSGITVAAFIAGLENGQVYANIHSQVFPSGEIRGQLPAVPEPGSITLLGTGLFALARGLYRKRR